MSGRKEIPYKVCGTKGEADNYMHDQATRLYRKGLTKRYGVKVTPCQKGRTKGHWVVVLVDRSPAEAPPPSLTTI